MAKHAIMFFMVLGIMAVLDLISIGLSFLMLTGTGLLGTVVMIPVGGSLMFLAFMGQVAVALTSTGVLGIYYFFRGKSIFSGKLLFRVGTNGIMKLIPGVSSIPSATSVFIMSEISEGTIGTLSKYVPGVKMITALKPS
jgi:hypothetical protein